MWYEGTSYPRHSKVEGIGSSGASKTQGGSLDVMPFGRLSENYECLRTRVTTPKSETLPLACSGWREGFFLARERGDHMIFTKPGIKRPVVVPRYDPLPVFIIRNCLRTASISRERYLELLSSV